MLEQPSVHVYHQNPSGNSSAVVSVSKNLFSITGEEIVGTPLGEQLTNVHDA